MTRSSRTRASALAVLGGVIALSAPALAVTPTCISTPVPNCTAGVPVTLTGLGGTRQFAVENVSGGELTSISLGTGGSFPFRTHVTDTTFSDVTQKYSVGATMSNLYLATASGHNNAIKVPSSDVSLAYATTPLSALGLSLVDLPKLSLSGTLQSCAGLPTAVQTVLGLTGGIPLPGAADLVNLTALCSALGAGVPVTATVDAALQTITPTVASLLDLPTALTGAESGPFANPAYAGTVGASDPAASGAPAATQRQIMLGTPGLSSNLVNALTTALGDALAGKFLVTADGAGARTTIGAVVSQLQTSSTLAISTVGNAIALLAPDKQVALLNSLTSTLVPPTLADIAAVTGQYYAFPILQATPSTPVAGTYDGTLTVTFVQG